ncbi:MAG: class I SAM-dependent rRNA methyltransferase [Deinococcaceae bacterium]
MRVYLKPGKEKKLLNHYPFGHQADLSECDSGVLDGDVVDVCTHQGVTIGRGYFNEKGRIPLRMLTLQNEAIDLSFFERRIEKAVQKRSGLDAQAKRLIYAEADGLPGLIVDRFGDTLSVQIRTLGTERHRDIILKALRNVTQCPNAFERSDTAERKREGLQTQTGTLWGSVGDRVDFVEEDIRFHFHPFSGQKTGFFLDQRDNRKLMREKIQPGQAFLDVYSYTGGFSLHAAKAGALATAIDKDAFALETLKQTAQENGLGSQIQSLCGDALMHLRDLVAQGKRFDHAVFDPPALVKRKDEIPGAKRIFSDGVSSIMQMLGAGGYLLVSTCAHPLRVEDLLDACRIAAGQAERVAEIVTVTYQPMDHPWMLLVPESLYLKSVLLKVL